MGDDSLLQKIAKQMQRADSSKDVLQRWKDEVGFPHGKIDDILVLSDPPYYTACFNPFIEDFIKHYGKPPCALWRCEGESVVVVVSSWLKTFLIM